MGEFKVSLPAVLRRAIAVLEDDGFRRHRDLLEELRKELDQLEARQVVRSRAFERRAAVEGEKFVWMEGDPDSGMEVEMEVRPASPGKEGRWWCISCGKVLAHNLDRDMHCQKKEADSQQLTASDPDLDPARAASRKPQASFRRLTLELGDHRARHVLGWRNFSSGFVEVP